MPKKCSALSRPSYHIPMKTVLDLDSLRQRLSKGAYGATAIEILDLCDAVSEIQSGWTPDAVSDFQVGTGINPQVWRRFLKISADKRLRDISDHLPASYTSLYSITLLSDDLLNDGIVLGVITPSTGCRRIQAWVRESRLHTEGRIRILYLTRDAEYDESDVEQIVERINATCLRKGFVLYASIGGLDPYRLAHESAISRESARSDMECSIEHEMYLDALDVLPSADPEYLDDLFESEMKEFVGELMDKCASRKLMMRRFGKLYCLKIALSHHRSESRSDRFNYRRRLRNVAAKYPHLSDVAFGVLDRYCQ